MLIRPMAPGDAREVAALSGQLGYPATPSQIEERFRSLAEEPASRLLVADAGGGRVVGWIHVCERHLLELEPFAEISALVVEAGSRRQGIGAALLAAAEEWARQGGYPSMRLRSNVVRTEAHPFYLRHGYEIIKTQYAFRKPLT